MRSITELFLSRWRALSCLRAGSKFALWNSHVNKPYFQSFLYGAVNYYSGFYKEMGGDISNHFESLVQQGISMLSFQGWKIVVQ